MLDGITHKTLVVIRMILHLNLWICTLYIYIIYKCTAQMNIPYCTRTGMIAMTQIFHGINTVREIIHINSVGNDHRKQIIRSGHVYLCAQGTEQSINQSIEKN